MDVCTLAEEEVPAFQGLVEDVFGGDPEPGETALWRPLLELDRTHLAWDGAFAAGCAAVFTFDMTVPGGPLPAAGVTAVGVASTHRRQGVLTRLMREQLSAIRDRGTEAFATLWASEAVIYGRFGYGTASRRLALTVKAHDPVLRGSAPVGSVRTVSLAELEPVARRLYDAERAWRPGMISRSDPRWAVRLADLPAHRRGASTQRCVVYERDGEAYGYAQYRMKPEFTDGRPDGAVRVKEVVAADADAHAGLWRFLCDIDLMRTVSYDNVAPDDPLPHRLADLRSAHAVVSDGLYVRLLDVPRALTSRAYCSSGSVVMEVRDELGYAGGRWLLDATPDGASCEPTDETADVRLSVTELSAAYLGDTSLRVLHGAGRVDEETPGAVARLSDLLSWPVAPWSPEIF